MAEDFKMDTKGIEHYFDLVGAIIVVLKTDHTVAFINRAGCDALGYKRDEVIGKEWTNNFAPESVKNEQELIFKQLISGNISSPYCIETQVLLNNNLTRAVKWCSELIKDDDGNITGLVGTVTDLKDVNITKAELAVTEERYRTIFESSPVGIALSGYGGRLLSANPAFETMLGYSEGELKEMTFADISHPGELAKNLKLFDEMLECKRDSYHLEKRYYHKDGRVVWAELTVSAVRGENGALKYAVTIVEDITKRKQVELALGESEERMRTVAEFARDAIIVEDTSGNVAYWNRAAEKLIGYKKEEAVGKSLHKLIVPVRFHESGRGVESNKTLELEVLKKDGTEFTAELSIALLDTKCKWARIGIMRDVTSRKKTELENEKLLHDLSERIKELNGLYSLGQVTEGSAEDVEELFNRFLNYVLPPSMQCPDKVIAKIEFDGKVCTSSTKEMLTKISAPLIVRNKARGFLTVGYSEEHPFLKHFEQNLIRAYAERLSKIIEANEYEEKLRHRHLLEEAIVKASKLFISPGGDTDYNEVLKLLGEVVFADRADIVMFSDGLRKFTITHEWCRPGVSAQIDTFQRFNVDIDGWWVSKLKNMETINISDVDKLPDEAKLVRKKIKSLGICSLLVVPISSRDGSLIGFMGFEDTKKSREWDESDAKTLGVISEMISNDIERNNAEKEKERLWEQLLQSKKMESVGRLAGGVANDFNNILTSILGFSMMAMDKLDTGHPAYSKLKFIERSGNRAAKLVRQLLALSNMQLLDMKINNLNQIVASSTKLLTRTLGNNVRFSIKTGSNLSNVIVDEVQIEQVLMNLAVNAKEAMPDGGEMLIETEGVTIDEDYAKVNQNAPRGKYAMLSVKDTGVGIAPEIKGEIFEPFFTTKATREGTGLGLSTLYGIVRQHKGFVEVVSEPGKGAEFKIFIPVTESEEFARGSDTYILPPTGTETVMVVEDDPDIRKLLVDIIEPRGYNVIEAGSGEDALQLSYKTSGQIDLLVTDVIMQGMNGWKLHGIIKQHRPSIKVIFISGFVDNQIVLEKIINNKMPFIKKPLSPQDLVNKVRDVLAKVN